MQGEVIEELLFSLSKFQKHVRVKRVQAAEFETDKGAAGKRILQVDFAMK